MHGQRNQRYAEIHMPRNTGVGLAMGLLSIAMGFGFIWHIWWLGVLGFVGMIVAFIVLGSVLEGIPAIVLFGPLLFPAARALGLHDVHYAMVVILAMGIGLFAPPFGLGFYAACAIGRVPPEAAMGRVWPYLAAVLAALVIVALFPWLSIGFL